MSRVFGWPGVLCAVDPAVCNPAPPLHALFSSCMSIFSPLSELQGHVTAAAIRGIKLRCSLVCYPACKLAMYVCVCMQRLAGRGEGVTRLLPRPHFLRRTRRKRRVAMMSQGRALAVRAQRWRSWVKVCYVLCVVCFLFTLLWQGVARCVPPPPCFRSIAARGWCAQDGELSQCVVPALPLLV